MKHRRIFLAVLMLLVVAPGAFGQGCSMCYASAEASTANEAAGLNAGILILLFPTLLLFGGVLITAIRRRNTDRDS